MSCDRRCFDKDDKWFGHDNCHTCPGQDSGRPMGDLKACAECHAYHDADNWPHKPEPQSEAAPVFPRARDFNETPASEWAKLEGKV